MSSDEFGHPQTVSGFPLMAAATRVNTSQDWVIRSLSESRGISMDAGARPAATSFQHWSEENRDHPPITWMGC